MNKSIEGLLGKPHNATAGDKVGAGTEAAGMPAVDSSISGAKFLGGASRYGVDGVSIPANGGGGHGGRRSQR